MGEDGRTISDDMSSLLHAAEEWANGRLFGTYSSNNLNSSNSYPMCVPIEEVARQVVLEICRTHNWNPETGTDNRLPRQNAIDVTAVRRSSPVPILPNSFQDATVSSMSTKLNGNNSTATPKVFSPTKYVDHQQEISSRAIQSLPAASEDIMNKTSVVSQNTSLNKSKQLDTSDQVIYNNNNDDDIDKTFTIKKNALLEITEEASASNQVIHNSSKQKPGKLPMTDTIPSLAKCDFYDNKTFIVHNVRKNSCILSNDNCSDTLDKNGASNSEGHPEMGQKFLSGTSEKSDINTALSSVKHRQFVVDNFITSASHIDSLKENQKLPEMLAVRNSGSNDISSRIHVDRSGNTVNLGCATKDDNIDATRNVVTVSTANETVTGTSMFTTNEIIEPTFSKTSMKDGNMRTDIANLPENDMLTPRTAIIVNTNLEQFSHYSTEKEKNLQVINSAQINASRNGTSCPTLAKKTRVLTNDLSEGLDRVQDNNLSQSVIQKSKSNDLIYTMTVTHPEKCSLTTADDEKPAVEEFKNTTLIIPPKSIYPCDSKNYANLRKNMKVDETSQQQLIVDENTDSVTRMIATADNQTQVTPSHLENRNSRFSNKQAFQTIMENNIPLHENDLNFKDMAEKKFITRAVQTDQENENERYNNSCFDSTPVMSQQSNIFGNTSFTTPLSVVFVDRHSTATKPVEERRSFLNDPIIFFNHMALTPRRKSLPASRAISSSNKSNMFARQAIVRPKTIREIIRKTPTLMTPVSKVAKSDVKQCPKPAHPVRSVNPPKTPNELPLENRASRLKAEYLAKKRAEQAEKSQRMQAGKFASIMAIRRSSVTRKLLSIDPENAAIPHSSKNSNVSSHVNSNNQTEKKTLSPVKEGNATNYR